jgi:DNA-binding NarL/FixJ family response regulator
MSITLLVADHHVAAVAGVKHFLADTQIEVVAEAGEGKRAVELALRVGPDVVLMAVRLPQEKGLGALARIKKARPDIPVLMTACDYHPGELAQAHKLGASGLLLKDFNRERLVAAIERVAAGGQIWSREEVRRVTGVLTSNRLAASVDVPLTRREGKVLQCVTRGHTNRQIAEELGISCETVKEHVQHIIRKIGVKGRTQAAVWAVRNRLV